MGCISAQGKGMTFRRTATVPTSYLATPAIAKQFAASARAPGAPDWKLPPQSMQWSGKSSAEICNKVKKSDSPVLRSLAEFTKHVNSASELGLEARPRAGRQRGTSATYARRPDRVF